MSHLAAADFLFHSKKKIEDEWLVRVAALIPETRGQTDTVLLNSLSTFIDELVIELKKENSSPESISDKAMSKIHGGERAILFGYNIPQLLKEFSILRQILNEEFQSHGVLTFEVNYLVDNAIDFVISKAAEEFVSVQTATTKKALESAERSNKDLEHFAAIAAHDLKAPLATVSSYLQLLKDNYQKILESDENLEYIEIMDKTSRRMLNLIDRLLDFARILHSDKPFVPVNLNKVIQSAIQNLDSSIKSENASVHFSELPSVMGDFDLLTQVFQNLLSNSLRYHSARPPEIFISCGESHEFWIISVKDNGIGFDLKQKEDIFSLYKTLHQGESLKGIGIGLATCRKVIELHGGTIWADLNPEGGSIFNFTLPKEDYFIH